MNKLEKQMCDILKKGIDHYNVVGTKAEFEAEGTRTDELLRLIEISHKAGAEIGLKIGGCEAIKDLYESKQLGVNYIIAPMVETSYALGKFINAKNLVYSEIEAEDTKFLFNCETITTLNNINEMIDTCREFKRSIDGSQSSLTSVALEKWNVAVVALLLKATKSLFLILQIR